eukprot:243379_1
MIIVRRILTFPLHHTDMIVLIMNNTMIAWCNAPFIQCGTWSECITDVKLALSRIQSMMSMICVLILTLATEPSDHSTAVPTFEPTNKQTNNNHYFSSIHTPTYRCQLMLRCVLRK